MCWLEETQFSNKKKNANTFQKIFQCATLAKTLGFTFVLMKFDTQATWYPVLARLWLEKIRKASLPQTVRKIEGFFSFSTCSNIRSRILSKNRDGDSRTVSNRNTASLHAARPGLPRHLGHSGNLTPLRNSLLSDTFDDLGTSLARNPGCGGCRSAVLRNRRSPLVTV